MRLSYGIVSSDMSSFSFYDLDLVPPYTPELKKVIRIGKKYDVLFRSEVESTAR
jgi:hypothetical protein